MNTGKRAEITLPSDNELLISRKFDAPPHLVYLAYSTPELVKRWWCGQRGVVTVCDIDLRVGGGWRYVLRANGGFDVAFHGTYQEIVPNEKIVATEVFEAVPDAEALNTATFEAFNGGTILQLLVRHSTPEHRDMHLRSGMEEGLNEALDLLENVAIDLDPKH